MKITWTCWLHPFTSMGVIAINIVKELSKLGIDVGLNVLNLEEININDYPPEVQEAIKKGFREDSIGIFFSYPDSYKSVKCKINIGYTGADTSGWYCTKGNIPPEESCNKYTDYMLTPSNYSKNIMEKCGVTVPIEVFPHGIDTNIFKPKLRTFKKPFTFLYTGELSERKGTQDLIDSFLTMFKNDLNYKLVLRANTHMQYYNGDEINKLCEHQKNIDIIWKNDGQKEIINYYKEANVYVYPSKADWFGMTPLEAVSTGLLTIATSTNGYYEFIKDYIIDLDYTTDRAEHQYLLGNWNNPNIDELEKLMWYVSNENIYMKLSEWSLNNVAEIHRKFSWEQVTKEYLVPFLEKVYNENFKPEKKETYIENNVTSYKRVTVGIPTKDRLLELSMLLQSLLFQTYNNFDIIIINDCHVENLNINTTFNSLINVLRQSGHKVTILEGNKKGPHEAGQLILENSKTEFILRLDDDVMLYPSFIEDLINSFTSDEIGAVGPIYLNPHMDLSKQCIDPTLPTDFIESQGKVYWDENNNLFLNGWLNVNKHPTDNLMPVEHLNSGFMYRKSAGLKIGGYIKGLSIVGHREESDFSYRIFNYGYKLFINPKAIALHFHPQIGGIRETMGEATKKECWDHDEKIFLDRMKSILPQKNREELISVIILTYGDHENLKQLLKGIELYTNREAEFIIINNDPSEQSKKLALNIMNNYININSSKLDVRLYQMEKELPVSEARNEGVKCSDPTSKYICFIDDDARILGRYNQTTDWLDYLYNRFNEEPDVAAVSPIKTWFEPLKTYCVSLACLFTSRKVFNLVGGFDPVFGNKEKGTWGYEDVDWSYRAISLGFKLLRVKGFEFPFSHEDTTFKFKTEERKIALLKGKELILSKYNMDDINRFHNRTIYPFTSLQMEILEPKLNIGCYHMYIPNFCNIDIKDDVNADLVCNGKDILNHFHPNSINLILSSHMIEHLNENDGKNAIKIWYSLLRDGGTLIIEAPDCENLDYKCNNNLISTNERAVIENGMPSEFGQTHLTKYTREKMLKVLKDIGFREIAENIHTSLGVNSPLAFRFDCIK